MISKQSIHTFLNILELAVTGLSLAWILFFKLTDIPKMALISFALLVLSFLFLNSLLNLVLLKKRIIVEEKYEWVAIGLFVTKFFATLSCVILFINLLLETVSYFLSVKRGEDFNFLLFNLLVLSTLSLIVILNQHSFIRFQKRKYEEEKIEEISKIGST